MFFLNNTSFKVYTRACTLLQFDCARSLPRDKECSSQEDSIHHLRPTHSQKPPSVGGLRLFLQTCTSIFVYLFLLIFCPLYFSPAHMQKPPFVGGPQLFVGTCTSVFVFELYWYFVFVDSLPSLFLSSAVLRLPCSKVNMSRKLGQCVCRVVAFGQTLGLTVRWVILTSPHQSVSNHVLMCRRWVSAGFEMHLQKFRRISQSYFPGMPNVNETQFEFLPQAASRLWFYEYAKQCI